MSLIDDFKNGKRYGTDWKAPTFQHMNNLVETVVNTSDNASTAVSNSSAAKTQADKAVTTANNADTKANNAVSTADAANSKSTQAVDTANQSKSESSSALTKATTAETNSSQALTKATAAETNSNQALTKATTAETNSSQAVVTANSAKTTAEGIDSKATQALANSSNALDKASEALNQVTDRQGSKIYDVLGNLLSTAKFTGDEYISVTMSDEDPNTFKISFSEETIEMLKEILQKCTNIEDRLNVMLPFSAIIIQEDLVADLAPSSSYKETYNGESYYYFVQKKTSGSGYSYKYVFDMEPIDVAKLLDIIETIGENKSVKTILNLSTISAEKQSTTSGEVVFNFADDICTLYIPYTIGTLSGFVKLVINRATRIGTFSILVDFAYSITSGSGLYLPGFELIGVEFLTK